MATGDLTVTEAEHEFLKAFVTILEHLKNRATKAERENVNLRRELTALREKVEYLTETATPPSVIRQLSNDPPAEIPEGYSAPLDPRTTIEMMADRDTKSV